jgi:hypothetical protein
MQLFARLLNVARRLHTCVLPTLQLMPGTGETERTKMKESIGFILTLALSILGFAWVETNDHRVQLEKERTVLLDTIAEQRLKIVVLSGECETDSECAELCEEGTRDLPPDHPDYCDGGPSPVVNPSAKAIADAAAEMGRRVDTKP